MKLLSTILPLILFFACKTTETTSKDLSIEEKPQQEIIIELASGTNSGFEKAISKVITSQAELTETWGEAYKNLMPSPKPPKIDFEEYQVVLVAMGMKNSGGYSIKIASVNNSKGNYMINVTETSPGKNCMTTEALTFPFQLIQVKKPTGKTIFNVTEKVIDCKSE